MRHRLWPAAVYTIFHVACMPEQIVHDQSSNAPLEAATTCPSIEGSVLCTPVTKDADSSQTPLRCAEQSIPSWETTIAELIAFRCVRCHNETFAWKGVLLTNYQNVLLNQKKLKFRVETNSLTEPLDPLEQKLILDFIKQGLPETEADCIPKSALP